MLLHTDDNQFIVAVDLELPHDATLESWRVPVEAFRKEVLRNLKADVVALHVEPDLRKLPVHPEPSPAVAEWEQMVRNAMIHLGAPLPTKVRCFTRQQERLCIVSIPQEYHLTVEESHARLTLLNKKLAEKLPLITRIMVTYDEV